MFYPAVAGTGTGTRPYFDHRLLLASGLDETSFDRGVTFKELDAQPEPASVARPVVIISSGFGSYLEFSTTLMERIASYGYVVIAVQTGVAAEAAVETPTEAMRDARMAQMASALDYLDDPNLTELVGPIDLDRVALGGHSYAGSIAFNMALVGERVTAAAHPGSARHVKDWAGGTVDRRCALGSRHRRAVLGLASGLRVVRQSREEFSFGSWHSPTFDRSHRGR